MVVVVVVVVRVQGEEALANGNQMRYGVGHWENFDDY